MFREDCSEKDEDEKSECGDETSLVVQRVDDDEDDEDGQYDGVHGQREEPLHHLKGQFHNVTFCRLCSKKPRRFVLII